MSSFGDQPSEFDVSTAAETPPPNDVTAAIGTDERRMHVRAYNYWVSLLEGRDFPSIEDLEPGEVEDFATNSVLLDFTCGGENPALPYIGVAIREECALDDGVRSIADVPSRSLLSRLTDHYMQIIANRAPVGFEAEFDNPRGDSICYRGILMPFSSDGDTIDFIYGVINWKHVGAEAEAQPTAPPPAESASEAESAVAIEQSFEPAAVEIAGIEEPDAVAPADFGEELRRTDVEDEPLDLTEELSTAPETQPNLVPGVEVEPAPASFPADELPVPTVLQQDELSVPVHFAWEDGPLADDNDVPIVELDENAALADRLWAARETAESVKSGEGRTRTALYKALSLAYDFAIAAGESPDDYAELLEESGVKAQARAPMTPIVKLVFGIDYDKARLTEFAAALSYADRQSIALGGFQDFIEKQPGGLKALVAAERAARRPEPREDTKTELARARLRTAPAISLGDVPAQEEFAIVLTRLGPDGTHEAVAVVTDEALVERAIRKAA